MTDTSTASPPTTGGSSVVKCKLGQGKVSVEVKDKDTNDPIVGATVVLLKGTHGKVELKTVAGGKATGELVAGKYRLLAKAPGGKGQTPDAPFEETPSGEIQNIELTAQAENPFTVTLKKIPRCTLTLAMKWKDPDGTARPFPEGLNVDLLMTSPSNSTVEAKVGADGLLVPRTAKGPLVFDQSRGPFKLRIVVSAKDRYMVCEPRGATAAAPTIIQDYQLSTLGDKRAFLLPKAAFGLELGKWTIAADGGAWKTAEKHFDAARDALGTTSAPATVTLEPRWQYLQLTYQDRIRGGDDQVSLLPQFLEGRLTSDASTEKVARSNWTIGADAQAAIQCLPWIVDDTTTKPDKDSLVSFTTQANTFIETPADSAQPRKVVVGAQATASGDRVRFYDLPAEWRWTNWFVRTARRTLDKTGGKFLFELTTPEEARGTKDAPLFLSLDDIVLYDDATTPRPPLAEESPVAVFKNTFSKGTPADANVSDVGLFRATTAITLVGTQTAEDAYYPTSEEQVLIRGGAGTYAALLENYIVEYPSWTRLVVSEATLFDCFDARTVAKAGEVRVVGARAAVRWVDPIAPVDGVDGEGIVNGPVNEVPSPGRTLANPLPTIRRPFGAAQLLVPIETPVTNARRDSATMGTKGTATPVGVADLGPLKVSRVGRAPDRAKEYSSALPSGGVIGRWDLCLLRCCGRADDGTELATVFQHFRSGYVFAGGPDPPASTLLDDPSKTGFIVPAIDALTTRWNGPDGIYNPGRASIEPVDPAKAPGKLKIGILRFFQAVPEARAGIRTTVVGDDPAARDWMNSSGGVTQSQEQNTQPDMVNDPGWFTAAHEMGHGGGLLDDYCEIWNHASYLQPGIVPLVPADPYVLDDVSGRESMMKANKVVRPRYFWHIAEWVHAVVGGLALQVKHDTATYKLPHHPRATSSNLPKVRSYLSFAYDSLLDAPLTLGTPAKSKPARCDLYLYAMGKDAYTDRVLVDLTETTGGAFTGMLVVIVHLGVKVHGGADHDQIRELSTKVTGTLKKRFGTRCVVDLTCGGLRFERCLIHISPRLLVSTMATPPDDDYLGTIEATTGTWGPGEAIAEGKVVVSGGEAYQASYTADPGGAGYMWNSSGTEPAWPGGPGTVDEGNIRWTHVGDEAAGKLAAHDAVIERKIKENQLHAILELGAGTTAVVETAGQLPRIKVEVNDMSALRTAIETLATTIKTVFANIKADRDALFPPPSSPDTYTTKVQEARGKRDAKVNERNALGPEPRGAVKQGKYELFTNELPPLEQALTSWEKAKALDDDYQLLHANVQVTVVGRVPEMIRELFKADATPLTDAVYDALTGLPGKATTASTQPDATRTSVRTDVDLTNGERTGMTVQAAQACDQALLPVRNAVGDLPARTRPADAATLVANMVAVATALRTFADTGTTGDPAKKAKAQQGRAALNDMCAAFATDRDEWLAGFAQPIANGTETEHGVHVWLVENDKMYPSLKKNEAASEAKTIEERLEQQFAAYLGLEVANTVKGYKAFADAFADSGKTPIVTLCKP